MGSWNEGDDDIVILSIGEPLAVVEGEYEGVWACQHWA